VGWLPGWIDTDVYVLSYQFALQLHYTVSTLYNSLQSTLQSNHTLQSNFTVFFACSILGSVKILRSLKYYSLAMVLAENL